MLSTMIKLTDNTEYIVNFVNGLSLLMTLEPRLVKVVIAPHLALPVQFHLAIHACTCICTYRYVNLLSSHSGFCNLLFDLIKVCRVMRASGNYLQMQYYFCRILSRVMF